MKREEGVIFEQQMMRRPHRRFVLRLTESGKAENIQ